MIQRSVGFSELRVAFLRDLAERMVMHVDWMLDFWLLGVGWAKLAVMSVILT